MRDTGALAIFNFTRSLVVVSCHHVITSCVLSIASHLRQEQGSPLTDVTVTFRALISQQICTVYFIHDLFFFLDLTFSTDRKTHSNWPKDVMGLSSRRFHGYAPDLKRIIAIRAEHSLMITISSVVLHWCPGLLNLFSRWRHFGSVQIQTDVTSSFFFFNLKLELCCKNGHSHLCRNCNICQNESQYVCFTYVARSW